MYKKFEKLLDDAEKALPREAFDAVLIVVGDDPDPQWDAQNLADALCDPEVLELNGLDDEEAVQRAYDFLVAYEMDDFHPDYDHACSVGLSMGEAYAGEYNEIAGYTTDEKEFVDLVNELDEQADADIVEKPARDWIDFRDGSMVNFATGERYARAVEAPDED